MADEFFIVDLRREFRGKPYITFWRPKNANYAYPLPWSGRYLRADIDAAGGYYAAKEGRSLVRFAVPCEVAERLGSPPGPGMVDGDVGPVVVNNAANRKALREAAVNAAFARAV